MSRLILIRGLPGSGKSTLAKALNKLGYSHIEADMYHINQQTSKYEFKQENLKAAHQWCKDLTLKTLDAGINVVVSNTFTQKWEMEDYLNMPHEISVIVATGEFPNIHNVPKEILERMKARWED